MNDRIEKTIQFDSVREAQALTGNGSSLLSQIGTALQVNLTARDTWLRLQGTPEEVERAFRFFDVLRTARNNGTPLQDQGIHFALRAFLDGKEEDLDALYMCRIEVESSKRSITPRTFGQQTYIHAIEKNDITFGIGPAGTGKTYLAMAMAVSALINENVSRIILTRPAIEAGEALGFLPGDVHQKVLPYLRPLYDALYDMMNPDRIERLLAQGVIEVAPLAYMRGRTLNQAFVILDEAQNTTPEQMLMFLTRLGFDSKCVVTGDLTQIDLPASKHSGLLEAKETLCDIPGIAFAKLKDADVVRHALVQQIIKAYRASRVQDRHPKRRKRKTG